jgi:hypothetical protein
MPVNFGFFPVEPRWYFVLQSGHDTRLPQGRTGCNDKRGIRRVARAPLPVRDAETIFNYVAQFALGPRGESPSLIMPLPKQVVCEKVNDAYDATLVASYALAFGSMEELSYA